MVIGIDTFVAEEDHSAHYNSAALFSPSEGGVRARYDKMHRVPFGEYLPFQSFLERLGIMQLTGVRAHGDLLGRAGGGGGVARGGELERVGARQAGLVDHDGVDAGLLGVDRRLPGALVEGGDLLGRRAPDEVERAPKGVQ